MFLSPCPNGLLVGRGRTRSENEARHGNKENREDSEKGGMGVSHKLEATSKGRLIEFEILQVEQIY